GQRTAAAAGAERLLQFARELDQPLNQRLAAPMDQLVDIAAPGIVVLVLERCQRGVQALDQRGAFLGHAGARRGGGGRRGHAAAPRRSNTLPSLSPSVAAVNGLIT